MFGVHYAAQQDAGGYYASVPTSEGRLMGLRTGLVGSGAAIPDASTSVIARDEFGHPSAWLRSYGAGAGLGLLQLQLPRAETTDLSQAQAVMEFGVTW